MAACYYRDSSWKEDTRLADEMRKYVQQGLTRQEMMSFLTRDFRQYSGASEPWITDYVILASSTLTKLYP